MKRFLVLLFSLISSVAVAQELDCQCSCKPKVNIDAGIADSGVGTDSGFDAGKPDSGSVSDSGTPVTDSGAPPTGSVPRPPASKGVGFYVVNGKIYDANGIEFRARGTNRTHIDSQSKWLGQTPSNFTRLIADPEPWIPYSFNRVYQAMTDANMGGTTANGRAVQAPGFWKATCSSDLNTFNGMVNRWAADAKQYQTFERYMWLNIANEALSDFVVWRDQYIAAVQKIRAAGWNGMFLIDAPGCGQQGMAIAQYGAAIVAADPQHNVAFDWHIYGAVGDRDGGYVCQWCTLELVPTMDALKASGLAVIIGEFGPGRNIGPSPTTVTPERIVELAEERGFGWATWSADDHNLPNERSDDNGFGHTRDGTYQNLTIWGAQADALWKKYGARPASIF